MSRAIAGVKNRVLISWLPKRGSVVEVPSWHILPWRLTQLVLRRLPFSRAYVHVSISACCGSLPEGSWASSFWPSGGSD